MSQKSKTRLTAVLLFVAMVVTTIGIVPVKVQAAESYPYDANLRNLLSDYQYIIKGNLNVKTHAMGGVAVGGDCNLVDFADAMVRPSYAGHLVKVGNIKDQPATGVPTGYHTTKFYYTTKEENAYESYQDAKFEKNTYLNMSAAFTNIQADSTALVSGATEAVKTGDKIIIDFSKSKKYVVPASLISSDRSVTLDIQGLDSVDDLCEEEYSISVTGLNTTSIFVDYGVSSKPLGYDLVLPITWKGNPMNNALKGICTDNYAGSQFVNAGMKLLWNFPDATKIVSEYISGHFVAPKADLVINGGNFEGGIVANSVTTSAQGHFYPYFKVGASRTTVPGLKIVETALVKEVIEVGDTENIKFIKVKDGEQINISTDNADYQWQVYDKETSAWKDIPGATGMTITPDESLEGKKIQCVVTGKNDYTGGAIAEGVVRALPPVGKNTSETSITIEAEEDFEYEIRDKDGNVIVPWIKDGVAGDADTTTGTITITGLTPDTPYDVVKRVPDLPVTTSAKTEIRTRTTEGGSAATPTPAPAGQTPSTTGAPGITSTASPSATPEAPGITSTASPSATPGAPGITGTASPSATPKVTIAPEDQTVSKNSIELKIPTIVMKKIMAPKMKFRIKLLNQKGAKVRCSSSNKKIATIDKKGLVKTKKKLGKAKLVINVTKGKKKIQYIVKLVVRTTIKKNYSLYKYKTSYKYPSVSLYKLLPKGKTYKIQLLHLNKTAKVTYKSNKPSVAKVNKKGKVTPIKNGRADVTVTIVQNGITYKYFVVVRVTQKGVESNTSYLKVIK